MPTYEYRCRNCGHELEVVQSFTDDALTECPACGGALRKVFGSIGVTFKGSGFYKTDNRSSSGSTSSTSSSGSSDSSSSSGSSGSGDGGSGSSSSGSSSGDSKPGTSSSSTSTSSSSSD